jgi:hypothetical protein
LSSSAIGNIYVRGLTGSDGNPGNTGNTGSTGNTGGTGSTGAIGPYYTSYVFDGDSVTITLSNGTTFDLNGTFRGATTVDQSIGAATGSNTGSGQIILSSVAGGTFSFKGLCAYGSLRASYTGANNEYISIDSIYFGTNQLGNVDPTTLSQRELIYLSTKTLAAGADLTHRNDLGLNGICGAFDFAYTTYGGASSDTSNHLNSSSKILNIGPIPIGRYSGLTSTNIIVPNGIGTTLGVFLDAGAAGTFVCKTPIGIQGITGPFKKNEVASISILIDSDDVWKFPSNVYFEPDQNYLSCGKNLIGLFTYDGGQTWIASVSHRGHGIFNPEYQCIPGYLYGSCCYQNADGNLACNDYSTRKQCDQLFGIFHPGVPCQEACGNDVSVCCTNGKCTENVSITECESFGGSYWAGYTCGFASSEGLNYPTGELNETEIKLQGRFCYNNCPTDTNDVAVCCKNGQCLGNYTRVQCELILGGRSVNASSCGGVDCCDYTAPNAACCICTTNSDGSIVSTCEFLSFEECNNRNGNYMGPGKQCNDVACGCICGDTVTQELGVCCKDGNCISTSYTQSECNTANGTWTQGGNCTNCQIPTGPGICCKNGLCTTATSQAQCNQECGNWISKINVQDSRCLSKTNCPGNKFTYNFGQNPAQLQSECEICSMSRPLITWPCKATGSFFGARHDFDRKSCQGMLKDIDEDEIRIDVLFNENNHYYVIPGVNSNNLLDKIKEAFNCNACPSGDDSECLPNAAYIQTMYSYIAYKNSNVNLTETAANVLWNSWINSTLLNGPESECSWTPPTCCRCNPDTSTLICTPGPNSETIVTFGVDTRIYRQDAVGEGSEGVGCEGFTDCGGSQGLSCVPNDDDCFPCSTSGGTWDGKGICSGDSESTIPYWSWEGYNDDWQNTNHVSSTPNEPYCCGPSSLFKTIKVNINNQEIHLPIICDSNCDDFETVT